MTENSENNAKIDKFAEYVAEPVSYTHLDVYKRQQDYALFPTMTVMENICIAMGHRDEMCIRERKYRAWA